MVVMVAVREVSVRLVVTEGDESPKRSLTRLQQCARLATLLSNELRFHV